jgi:large repetitive protein
MMKATTRPSLLFAAVPAIVLFVAVATAGATPAPIQLSLSQGVAFGYLGHSCGGIQEQTFATGFDPTTGFPVGNVMMSTRCGGSGRGGGYHVTTYTASATAMWDFSGVLVTSSVPATGTNDPNFTAFDTNGNELYNSSTRAYLQWSSTFVPVPRVLSISTAYGPATGGTSVTITGTGFTNATSVSFGATPAATFTIANDNSIAATAPA